MGKKKNKRKNHNTYNTNTNTNTNLALALNETPDGNRFSYGSGNYTSNNSVLSNFKNAGTTIIKLIFLSRIIFKISFGFKLCV